MVFEKSARVGGIQGNAWARGGFWFNYYQSSRESTFFGVDDKKLWKQNQNFLFDVLGFWPFCCSRQWKLLSKGPLVNEKRTTFVFMIPNTIHWRGSEWPAIKKGSGWRRLLAFFCELARLQRWWWFCSGKWRLPCTHCGKKVGLFQNCKNAIWPHLFSRDLKRLGYFAIGNWSVLPQ